MLELRVAGAEQFRTLARRLREAGDKDLQRELYRGLNRAIKPLTANIRQSALEVLPSRGGLNVTISTGTKIKLQRRVSARSASIKLIATAKTPTGGDRELRKMDKGSVRHPLFRNRQHWFTQRITPGWWSTPTLASESETREQLLIALRNVRDKIEG